MPDTNSGYTPLRKVAYLRAEAIPRPYDLLTDGQRRAFDQVVLSLAEAAGALSNAEGNRQHPSTYYLDRNRSTRMVVLAGARGSGKTTVMLSLIDQILEENDEPHTTSASNRAKRVGEILPKLRRQVVWLETLDLEPLPRPTNLLSAILVRIERAVERFGYTNRRPRAPLEPTGSDGALASLADLQRDAGLAWDGNLIERAVNLDPDSFSAELKRAERARVNLNYRLTKVLDDLARHVEWGQTVRDPIFVLPIDDFDLNPARCAELLYLLRVISSPRLFLLMLGNDNVPEITMNLKIAGDLHNLLHSRSTKFSGWPADNISSVVGTASAHAVRKLLPPGQYIIIPDFTYQESLAFRPPQEGEFSLAQLLMAIPVCVRTARVLSPDATVPSAGTPEAPMPRRRVISGRTLDRLLGLLLTRPLHMHSFELPHRGLHRVPTLRAFQEERSGGGADSETSWRRIIERLVEGEAHMPRAVRLEPGADPSTISSEKIETDPEKGHFAHDGRDMLTTSARNVADLWHGLRNVAARVDELLEEGGAPIEEAACERREHEAHELVIDFFARRFPRVVGEDEELVVPARQVLRDAFRRRPSGWTFATDRIHTYCSAQYGSTQRSTLRNYHITSPGEIGCRIQAPDVDGEIELRPDTRLFHEFRILHDLVSLGEGSGHGKAGVIRDDKWDRWFRVEWQIGGEAVAGAGFEHPVTRSFMGIELFANTWRHFFPYMERLPSPLFLEATLYYWLSCITSLVIAEVGSAPALFTYIGRNDYRPKEDSSGAAGQTGRWESLRGRLTALLSDVESALGRNEEPQRRSYEEFGKELGLFEAYAKAWAESDQVPWAEAAPPRLPGREHPTPEDGYDLHDDVADLLATVEHRDGPPWPLLHKRIESVLSELDALADNVRPGPALKSVHNWKRHRRELLERWLCCLVSCLMPEKGVPNRLARKILSRPIRERLRRHLASNRHVVEDIAQRRRAQLGRFEGRGTEGRDPSPDGAALFLLGHLLIRPDLAVEYLIEANALLLAEKESSARGRGAALAAEVQRWLGATRQLEPGGREWTEIARAMSPREVRRAKALNARLSTWHWRRLGDLVGELYGKHAWMQLNTPEPVHRAGSSDVSSKAYLPREAARRSWHLAHDPYWASLLVTPLSGADEVVGLDS